MPINKDGKKYTTVKHGTKTVVKIYYGSKRIL